MPTNKRLIVVRGARSTVGMRYTGEQVVGSDQGEVIPSPMGCHVDLTISASPRVVADRTG